MKKIKGVAVCYGLSILMFLGFVVHTAVDYSRYNGTLNSAPFTVWITVNAIYFLLPAAVLFAIGLVLKKKAGKA